MPGNRRSLRLTDYDYSRSGAYFVTICTQHRACLFGQIREGTMERNAAGTMIEETWDGLSSYPGVEVDAFVVMPNHVHGIVVLNEEETAWLGEEERRCGAEGRHGGTPPTEGGPTSSKPRLSLPDVMQRFKSLTTARYRQGVKEQEWPPFPGTLWQRNYYEHVIRGEEELARVREYILVNPLRWHLDRENPDNR